MRHPAEAAPRTRVGGLTGVCSNQPAIARFLNFIFNSSLRRRKGIYVLVYIGGHTRSNTGHVGRYV